MVSLLHDNEFKVWSWFCIHGACQCDAVHSMKRLFFWHVGLVQVANFSSAVHLPENMVPLMVHCSLFNVSVFTVQCPQVLGWNLITCQFEVLCWTCKFVCAKFLQCFGWTILLKEKYNHQLHLLGSEVILAATCEQAVVVPLRMWVSRGSPYCWRSCEMLCFFNDSCVGWVQK